jgi:small GTP-binding protein
MYKVVVTGPFNVGKTEFVRSISDIPIVSTERRITDHLRATKEETTVAMDYGQVRLRDAMFHLYGTPGQPRFDFMWDILAKEMDAFLVLVDSGDRETFLQAKRLLRIFGSKDRVPCMVVANKQDQDNALPIQQIIRALGLEGRTPVVPCIATDKSSVRKVLEALRRHLK